MRVCFVTEFGEGLYCGLNSCIKNLKSGLEEEGVDVVINKPKGSDIIHFHTPFHRTFITQRRFRNIPQIATVNGTPAEAEYNFVFPLNRILGSELFGWNYFRHLYNRCDRVVAPTEFIKDLLKKRGITTDIEVISNGVNTREWTKSDEFANRVHSRYNIEAPFVFSVGQIIARKGLMELIQIAKSLKDVNFVHAGGWRYISSPVYYMKFVRSLPKNIRYVGNLTKEEMIGAYSLANAYIHTTFFETEGLSLLEAMSVRLPCVVRDIPPFREITDNGRGAVIAKDGDEFVAGLRNILEDDEFGHRYSSVSRQIVAKRDIKEVATKVMGSYEHLIGRG